MQKYCIVTCIFNGYEFAREPLEVDKDADYILFTDNKETKSESWNVVYLPEFDTKELTGVQKTYILKYTFYKYLDLSKYDYLIQLDSSIVIQKSLSPIIEYMRNGRYDISVAPHFWRKDLMEEYKCWVSSRGLQKKYVDQFVEATKDFDNKSIKGLIECSMKIYRNCKEALSFIDDVHKIMTESNNNEDKNDQCYPTYILYKHLDKLKVNYHSASLYRYSDYMKMYGHGGNSPCHNSELKYPSYNINFLGRDTSINTLDTYINSARQ